MKIKYTLSALGSKDQSGEIDISTGTGISIEKTILNNIWTIEGFLEMYIYQRKRAEMPGLKNIDFDVNIESINFNE